MYLDVFLRSCSHVEAVNKTPRPLGVPKSELSLRCLTSLLHSLCSFYDSCQIQTLPMQPLLDGMSLTIIDDHSDKNFLMLIEKILFHAPFPTQIVSLEGRGNGESLKKTYQLAREIGRDLIYFVEDDYLHEREAIKSMIHAYFLSKNHYHSEVCIFPCDYIDLYKRPIVSTVILADDRYWRQVSSTTGTVMVTQNILKTHWHYFMSFARYDEDPWVHEANTINHVYQDYPCLSPMPTLALHMHEGMQSVFVPWQKWFHDASIRTQEYIKNA